MIETLMLLGWGLAAVECWRAAKYHDRCEAAESLNRALLHANKEKDDLLTLWVRQEHARREGVQMAHAIRELYTMPVDGQRLH